MIVLIIILTLTIIGIIKHHQAIIKRMVVRFSVGGVKNLNFFNPNFIQLRHRVIQKICYTDCVPKLTDCAENL